MMSFETNAEFYLEMFVFFLEIPNAAIQAEIEAPNIPLNSPRRRRQTSGEKIIIEGVLHNEFCVKLQSLLNGGSCAVQSIRYKTNGHVGIFINFLIVLGPFSASLSAILTQLNTINNGLTTINGIQFAPGVISGKF